MYAVIRTYSDEGAKDLFDLLEKRKADVEKVMRTVKGLVSYSLVRTNDGGFSVSVCNDKAGADESMKVAREWIRQNAANTGVRPPSVSDGSVVLHIK